MLYLLLSIGVLNALIPLLIILVLIAAAAGLTRGYNIFALFGISTLLGMGATGKATLKGKSLTRTLKYYKGGAPGTALTGKYVNAGKAKVKSATYRGMAKGLEKLSGKVQNLGGRAQSKGLSKTSKVLNVTAKGLNVTAKGLGGLSSFMGVRAYKAGGSKEKIRMEAEVMAQRKTGGHVNMSVKGVEKIMKERGKGTPEMLKTPVETKFKGAWRTETIKRKEAAKKEAEQAKANLVANAVAHGGRVTKEDMKQYSREMKNAGKHLSTNPLTREGREFIGEKIAPYTPSSIQGQVIHAKTQKQLAQSLYESSESARAAGNIALADKLYQDAQSHDIKAIEEKWKNAWKTAKEEAKQAQSLYKERNLAEKAGNMALAQQKEQEAQLHEANAYNILNQYKQGRQTYHAKSPQFVLDRLDLYVKMQKDSIQRKIDKYKK